MYIVGQISAHDVTQFYGSALISQSVNGKMRSSWWNVGNIIGERRRIGVEWKKELKRANAAWNR